MTLKCGVDLGGSKIEFLALNDDGSELFRKRVATPQGDYQATLLAIQSLLGSAERVIGPVQRLGIGTPGAFSKVNGSLKNSNSTCLNGKPILQDLQALLNRPVRIANDADCFALSEAMDGSGTVKGTTFGVILGTGVGAGIIVNGKPLSGPNAIAGEWGHNPLPWPRDNERPGLLCYCGQHGCIETFLSGPGLSRSYAEASGLTLDSAAIAEKAAHGDIVCENILQQYEERLARALAHVINIIDPDIIVLGGGLSKLTRLYENIPRYWGNFVFSDRVDTTLAAPTHGDSSGVRGAAWLWDSYN